MNSIPEIIQKTTAVGLDLEPVIERIMREDIFHGPLDWQSADELITAAKEALAIYDGDKEFHDADTVFRKARWARILAERQASEGPDNHSLRMALEDTKETEDSALRVLRSFKLQPTQIR